MAAGANLGEKLFGMVKTIGPVFQSYAPGLGLFDLAVGVAGAVILYFVVQSKIKKARKFRRDMEYGSARWGTEADIKPFVDPKFENNIILTGTEFLTMNTRPKNPANARNLNACVIGSSGSGKTRFWLTPQLLQAHSSYVVVDPKGGTLAQCGYFLQKKKGYKVKVFNSIDFSKSMHYNPMAYIKTESDVLKFVNALIANTKGDGKEGDEFWTKAETLLYCALVAYIVFEGPEEERKVQTCDLLCPGVFLVSTASHGGTMVSNEVAAFLSPAAKRCGFKRGGYLCFEEDTQEDVVLRELLDKKLWQIPERIKDKAAFEENINLSIRRYNPEYWRARQSGLEAAQAARKESPARQTER